MSQSVLRHRDASGRVTVIDKEDAARERFIQPSDGRLAPLLVQESYETHPGAETKSWMSVGKIRLQVSPILDLVHWTYSSILEEGSEERHYDAGAVLSLALKWIPSCIILALMLLIPQNLEGNSRNNGFYDPVRYRDWGYTKASRNIAENRSQALEEVEELEENAPLLPDDIEMSSISHHIQSKDQSTPMEQEMDEDYDDLPARQFRPRFLCFVNEDGYETWKVTDWMQKYGDNTDFVFLSYTRKQFCVATKPELAKWDLPDAEMRAAYVRIAQRDRQTLVQYGIEAARSANKPAFWLDFECLRDADNQAKATSESKDVYRICDIVRAAHSMVILAGPTLSSRLPNGIPQNYSSNNMKLWLQEWGTRLWTLPEILLCSPEHPVKIYAIGGPSPPEQLAKRSFAARGAWKDAKLVRQLVDHYESSIHLTPLELVSIALECFSSRQTDQFHQGDIAYALMGLLRRRPAVNDSDSSFEAFARLSLANDSDALLERLLCMQSVRPNAPWYEIRDAWGVRLWDIEPRCQIAGIVDDQTVTLDGAFGATIQWDSMDQVAFFKRPTLARTFGKILLRGVPAYLISALIMTITGAVLKSKYDDAENAAEDDGYADYPSSAAKSAALGLLIPGIIFLIPSALITLAAPAMLLDIYRGKFWSTQALFVGVEGRVDVGEAERHLFGFNHGRLKWSTNGSTLSRHKYVQGECVPVEPAVGTSPPGQSLFTLIDTYAMTATCFYAERPPVAVVVCGHEGGMQRAVLCSYDWRTQTFAREAVLRVKTLVLDRMFRMDRFRFALRRTPHEEATKVPVETNETAGLVGSGIRIERAKGRWEMWKIDLLLLPFMWWIYAAPTSWSQAETSATDQSKVSISMNAGFLVALIPSIQMMHRLQIGHIVAVAVLLYSALDIGLYFLESMGGAIAIQLIIGMTRAVVLPAFVFLTGAWYTAREQVLRIMIWGYCVSLLKDALVEINSQLIISIVYTVICMPLAGLAYFFLRTPDQARWISGQERARLLSRQKGWDSTSWSGSEVLSVLKEPQIWFFFVTSLLNSAYTWVDRPGSYVREWWYADLPAVIVALVVGFLLTRVANFRILVMSLLLCLGFAASMVHSFYTINHKDDAGVTSTPSPSLARGLAFLISMSGMVQFFIWSLSLSNTSDITRRLTTICIIFAGDAVGGMIGSAYLTSVSGLHISEAPPSGYILFISVTFGLQLLAFITWLLYYWKANKKLVKRRNYSTAIAAGSDWSGSSGILEGARMEPRKQSFKFTT